VKVFGTTYAGAYDALYGEKNYSLECDMIEALLIGSSKGGNLLDLGCGTGNHAVPLADRGYTVTGVDLSDAMLERAREKAVRAGISANTQFHNGDVRTVRLDREGYDAALMMFAVLGYQQSDDDVRAALGSARYHLKAGSAFIFDVWYGPGVVADRPGPRERIVENAGEKIVRRTNTHLDEARHLCSVKFDLEIWRGERKVDDVHEEHLMRYFFPDELQRFAAECGFVLKTLRNFPDWQQPVGETSWNAVGVFQAI